MEWEKRKWSKMDHFNVMPAYLMFGFCIIQFVFIGLFITEAIVAPVIGVEEPPMQKWFEHANTPMY